MEKIPGDLVINWDQTSIHYAPVSTWTMAKAGSQRVEIADIDDRRQLIAVFGGTSTGEFLPVQLIYKGNTHKSLPLNNFPSDWHVTFTDNHWVNKKTVTDYLERILFPFIEGKEKICSWMIAIQRLLSLMDSEHSVQTLSWNCLH